MDEELGKIMKNLSISQPSNNLKEVVLKRILLEKQKKIRRRIIFFRLGFSVSIASMFSAGVFFGHEIMVSDFWSVAGLLFTDIKLVGNYWQEFVWSLMETFPSVATIGVLVPLFALMLLIKKYGEQEAVLKFDYR